MIPKTMDVFSTREEWLAARRTTGIGASEAAAVLGASRWRTPLEVWAEKVQAVESDLADAEAAAFGLLLEPVIAERFERVTGFPVLRVEEPTLFRARETPFVFASFDAFAEFAGEIIPAQFKTASEYERARWQEEGPPVEYQIQVQQELYVAETEVAFLVALFGGRRLDYWLIERHPAFLDRLLAAEAAFWAAVEQKIPPPPGPGDAGLLLRLHPRGTPGLVVGLPPEAEAWDAELTAAEKERKAWEAETDRLKNLFRAAIGDAEAGVTLNGTVWQWRNVDVKGYEVQPRTDRRLTRKGGR